MNKDVQHHLGNIGLMVGLVALFGAPLLGFGFMHVEDTPTEVLSETDIRQNVPVVDVFEEKELIEDITEEATYSENLVGQDVEH